MEEGFDRIVKQYKLYQADNNSIWYTDEPLFCDFSKKQIYKGELIATEKGVIGVYHFEYFYRMCKDIFIDDSIEYVYALQIRSSAKPIQKTKKAERVKMTVSLRYKILQRDKFRCKACGAKAGDVELQIDHIIPVSKGGKTSEDNLQTLCSNCNMGKSDTIYNG